MLYLIITVMTNHDQIQHHTLNPKVFNKVIVMYLVQTVFKLCLGKFYYYKLCRSVIFCTFLGYLWYTDQGFIT